MNHNLIYLFNERFSKLSVCVTCHGTYFRAFRSCVCVFIKSQISGHLPNTLIFIKTLEKSHAIKLLFRVVMQIV